ncbi:glycosyltransferase family 4 protein [Desulfotalea psychrophila]|uniref:Probable lipopolysaccharide biosynthesis protein (WbpT) n=1 Tax=Desulfotalea psychrophila (strain LSv54 / DSM 12343) TaxID=177439 RepID=Q6ASA2_DESPS|nr:glycosyltransferase [Desulfotalea psychrophila]CAG34761.1 probable lipopolysaccharide biosynthesis protein (WbpT) [Desulfotalea psychrophila LSv54]
MNTKQKKVLHIITGLNDGGAEGVLTRLCLHSKAAIHVVISLMDQGKYGTVLKEAGVRVYCLGMNPGSPSIFKFFRLVKLIRVEQPDVVQTWMYHADLLGGIAARLAGVRSVFWGIRHSTLEKGKSKCSTIMIARLCAFLSGWIPDKIICCANKALAVHADIGYKKSNMSVIQNGYDLSRFKPDFGASIYMRQKLGLSQDEFVLGTVGRFDPLKDHLNLLQAFALVTKQVTHIRCVLVGKGLSVDNDVLMSYIAELGLQDSVLLAGQCGNIPAVMNALDLHVLSSCSEGFPNVIAEAMACGTPCVSTDVGDALEIIGEPESCCPARNSEALAGVIMNMVEERKSHPDTWQARKDASAQRIAEQFSLQGMVHAYETCWRGIK